MDNTKRPPAEIAVITTQKTGKDFGQEINLLASIPLGCHVRSADVLNDEELRDEMGRLDTKNKKVFIVTTSEETTAKFIQKIPASKKKVIVIHRMLLKSPLFKGNTPIAWGLALGAFPYLKPGIYVTHSNRIIDLQTFLKETKSK